MFMDEITEHTGYFGTKYKRIRENESYEVNVAGVTKEYSGYIYMFVLGTHGRVYFDTYKYLNKFLSDEGYSKRELALRALKFLYSYIELFKTDIKYIDVEDKNKILLFLEGGKRKGQYISYDLKTVRSSSTINNYFGVYRSFFKYLGLNKNIFAEESGTKKIVDGNSAFNSRSNTIEISKYSINLNEVNKQIAPKYIKSSEYSKIEKLIEDQYTLREKIIIKLMYIYGLRIGEVLGLTLEDVQGEEVTKQKDKCRIILRNRLTDKKWQHAKGLYTIKSPDHYHREEYKKEIVGYRIVPINLKTYNLIQEYIDDSSSPFSMSEKAHENYTKKNIADKVSNTKIDRNAYIFISKNFTPITGGGWNKILKGIFQKVGIKIDKGKKEHNLSHRFRHGFAMYKVLKEGYKALELAHVLGHTKLSSVSAYFNPTEDDLVEFAIKEEELTKRGLNL